MLRVYVHVYTRCVVYNGKLGLIENGFAQIKCFVMFKMFNHNCVHGIPLL